MSDSFDQFAGLNGRRKVGRAARLSCMSHLPYAECLLKVNLQRRTPSRSPVPSVAPNWAETLKKIGGAPLREAEIVVGSLRNSCARQSSPAAGLHSAFEREL